MERVVLEISWASILRILIIGFLGFVFFLARDVIITLLLVLVISAGLAPAVTYLERRSIPRVLGTIGIFVLLFLVLGLVIYAILPIMLAELNSLLTTIISTTNYPEAFGFDESARAIDSVTQWLRLLEGKLFSGDLQLVQLTSNILGGLTLAFSAIIISFYLTASRDGIERFLRAVLPEKSEEYVLSIFDRAKKKIGAWFQTQILLSFIIGILTFIGLKLLGVPYSLLLASLAGILEIVPFVGPIFAGGIAMVVGFSASTALGVYVLLLFLAIQQLESHVIVPLLFQRRIGLHPVVILSALLIGGKLAGIVGLILAIPIAVAVQEILEDWGARKGRSQSLPSV